MNPARLLRALVFASLAALVFHTHVFVAFHAVRAKVVQAPIPAVDGAVRVTTAGFPQLKDLRPPFAVIARIKAAAPGTARFRMAFDGAPACERVVAGGATRRVDCAATTGGGSAADREVVVSGPTTPWTLEYLELATHHGNATGALTLYIVPPGSSAYDSPAAGWTLLLWAGVAAILLWVSPRPMPWGVGLVHQSATGLIVALLLIIQGADRLTDFRLVLASGAFLLWLALLLAPRLLAGLGTLRQWTGRVWRPVRASAAARVALTLERHPAFRPTPARLSAAWHWCAVAAVVGLFCVPLFVNLREPDVRGDEAIYSYAVERILDTGDWLTPRSIPTDDPFLEKPPLKFWLVAGGMRLGLLPTDELGMRWLDALFGAVAFLYVYAFGRRLAGPLCGAIAVLVLFTLDPLVFEHGLRSNNMEAVLFLSYCAGMFHFAAWVEAGPRRARWHAAAVCAAFFFGFMTKFVAAFFLPAVCVAALAVRGGGWRRLRDGWRDWVVPALISAALAAPWFVYQSLPEPAPFWRIIFGAHVYERFTAALDTAHLHPWHYYLVYTWDELRRSGTLWMVLAGLVALAGASFRPSAWRGRLLLLWAILPIGAISVVTSKLGHYAYPFWPPMALAAGFVVARALAAIDERPGGIVSGWLLRLVPARLLGWWRATSARRGALLVLVVAALAAAAWTAVRGPFTVGAGGAAFYRNTTVVGPLAIAVALLLAGGQAKWLLRLAVVVALLVGNPVQVYQEKVAHAMRIDHPIRALRDCMESVKRSGARAGSGVLGTEKDIRHYAYYYYLWRAGAWTLTPAFSLEQTERRLWTPGEQTPVLISPRDFETLVSRAGGRPMPGGAAFEPGVAVLLPGPFRACQPDILAAAGRPLWKRAASSLRR